MSPRSTAHWAGLRLRTSPPAGSAFPTALCRPRENSLASAGPFSRVVRVDALPKEGQTFAIEANPTERAELAEFNKLPSIEVLTASLNLRHTGRGGVRVTGAVHADLTQVCGVSLDPFPASVDEAIDVRF